MRLCLLILCAGCYTSSRAVSDVNFAWRGYRRGDVEVRLGRPQLTTALSDGTMSVRWIRTGYDVTLPSGSLDVDVTPASVDVRSEAQSGRIRHEYSIASAIIDPNGSVASFDSPSLAAGIPDGTNLRTGAIFGAHVGAGALDNATTPMPAVGMYIGGMISPQVALVGAYEFVNGKGDGGFAMGHALAFAIQYWPDARVAMRGGSAFVLDLEPGLLDPVVAPGFVAGVSYAFMRRGSLALDVQYNLTVSLNAVFGTLGVGVNLN